jgi:hypothetical protein
MAMGTLPLPDKKIILERSIGSENVLVLIRGKENGNEDIAAPDLQNDC